MALLNELSYHSSSYHLYNSAETNWYSNDHQNQIVASEKVVKYVSWVSHLKHEQRN